MPRATMTQRAEALLLRGHTRRKVRETLGCSASLVAAVARTVRDGTPPARRGGLGGRHGPEILRVMTTTPGISRRETARLVGCSVARVGQVANYLRDHERFSEKSVYRPAAVLLRELS